VLDCAKENGYAAIELRSLAGTENLPDRPEFAPGRIAATRRQLAERGLRVACVGSSAQLHERDESKRALQMREGLRYIDLAQRLGARYVRVFGDRYPEGEARAAVVERVTSGLRQLGGEARRRGVGVLLESHGEFTDSPTLAEIMRRAGGDRVGLLWDAHHTYVEGHEQPEDTLRLLGRFIRHVHLKDSLSAGGARRYVLTGAGDIPVRRQVELLAGSDYRGVISFEWEKRWEPEIEEPEIAIPHFARTIRGYMGG
jgi:sugar phosphate isomerase/epimerase